MDKPALLSRLAERGVVVLDPSTVYFAGDVDPERICAGTVIHPGCRLSGADLAIGPDCTLGEEGPLTLRGCQLGAAVRLRGGTYERATILDGADGGVGAHVRPGTLMEEEVVFGHCVGLKQTILLPFVTMGSLANFCDCLMSGGTSRKNHSEVGSSYIHFNFTPHGDKATASLLGDVPRGVMLDRHPIFLGGQGGLVGPSRIEFGTVLPAGQICRDDVSEEDRMVVPPAISPRVRQYDQRIYGRIWRTVSNSLAYIGNLFALDIWYRQARAPRMSCTPSGKACVEGALARISECLGERIKWIGRLREKIVVSAAELASSPSSAVSAHAAESLESQRRFLSCAAGIMERFDRLFAGRASATVPDHARAALDELLALPGSHVDAVKALPPLSKAALTRWLQEVCDEAVGTEFASSQPGQDA